MVSTSIIVQYAEVKRTTLMYKGRTFFKSSLFIRLMAMMAFVVFSIIAYIGHQSEGWSIYTTILTACAIFCILSVADAFSSYIQLNEKNIEFRRNLVRKFFDKGQITRCTWAKGCPTLLVLKNEEEVTLPEVDSKNLSNSINSWLKSKNN